MRQPTDERPLLLIIAGPNGSGKSSVYRDTDSEMQGRSVWIVNPDLLTARIQASEGLDLDSANLAAVNRLEAWIEASIDVHKSIGVETVLSTAKYRRLVEHAQRRGFVVWLLYVILDTPRRNIERVRLRVRKGGHAVAEDKIVSRYYGSLAQLPWFLDRADAAWLYDNSGATPQLVGEKKDGIVRLAPDTIAPLRQAVQSIAHE